MATGIFGIGMSGLHAAQAGLLTTGHNISNAATPGYNRQMTIQESNLARLTGSGYTGQGVNITTVRRAYSESLSNQVVQAQSQGSQLDSYYAQIKQLDNILGDPSSGLSPALQSFFTAVDDVAANPAAVPSRQALLSGAQSLISRFQSLSQRFSEIREGISTQITGSVTTINSLAQQIARLNQSVVTAQSLAVGKTPNDLLDQRDALIAQLNQEISATVVKQDDGSYNIFIGNGQTLVMGPKALALTATASPSDLSRIMVGYPTGAGTVLIPDASLQGGALGGYLAFRNGALDTGQNALGRIAIGLAQTFNDQHRLGQDLNGALGADFFRVPAPGVIPHSGNNTASAISASISSVGALTVSDYKFSFDGANYTLIRLSDGAMASTATAPSGAAPFTFDGISITAATINSGESFLIHPTRNGARDIAVSIADTARIAAAAPIRTNAALTNTSTATISAGSVNAPPPANADLQQLVTMTFHFPYDGQFDVTGTGTGLPATNQVYTAGSDISFNGWTVRISGIPEAGDVFTVGSNINGTADNRNALLLGQLRTGNTLLGGKASYLSAYGQFVSDVGNKTRELEVTSKAQAILVAQSRQAQQALSGVNLDEEAANLLRYQQAYQAAGKIMQIANSLFDTVLDLGR